MRDARRSGELLESIEASLKSWLHDRPLLTIFGERNDPLHLQRRWRQLFPAARQVAVATGNHFPMNDDPVLFAAAIRDRWQEIADVQSELAGDEVSRGKAARFTCFATANASLTFSRKVSGCAAVHSCPACDEAKNST